MRGYVAQDTEMHTAGIFCVAPFQWFERTNRHQCIIHPLDIGYDSLADGSQLS
jgi:hypothetical protein